MNLSNLKPGESTTVLNIESQRLQDIGLINGTAVKCLHKSPMGDPVAYLIRGAVIALRYEDTSRVEVMP